MGKIFDAGFVRTRWAAVGAAVAVTVGAGGGLGIAHATATSGARPAFTAMAPCRLLDTRPAPFKVGSRSTPIGAAETYTVTVTGTNGNCTVPTDALAVAMNVTVVDPTAGSFMTVFPAGTTRPNSSSVNWVAGRSPTANQLTVALSIDGKASFYNDSGTVDVVVDLVGYTQDHNHDDRYYSKAEVDAKIAAKSISGYTLVRGSTAGSQNAPYTVTASCPSGTKVLGGGGSQGSFNWFMDDSRPNDAGTGWEVQYSPVNGATDGIGEAWAICGVVNP